MNTLNLAVVILALPALAALLCGLFGRQLRHACGVLAAAAMLGTFACWLILIFSGAVPPEGVYVPLSYEWLQLGSGEFTFNIEARLWLDPLTMVMLFVVSFVGSMVFVYAIGYMAHDEHSAPGAPRFFAYLSLFAFSMYLLVLGANFTMLFIGWEGVGLCSYLLIGYYYDQPFDHEISCADAGKKAFIVNRIGDFGFLLGMLFILYYFKTLDFHEVMTGAGEVYHTIGAPATLIFTTIALLLFLGATGKSAQIPLYIWLPDAMAGPTPVSALIHAATMVTAGVYMVARCNALFVLAEYALPVVAVIGGLTAFVAATIGITQRDIKKALAYSTVSQLGYMFLACGMGAFAVGIFHVYTHAFFKACLFLCSGSVILALHHEQDMFKMGGLKAKLPVTHWTYLIATVAIAGIPPFAGFWSKDEILWKTFSHGGVLSAALWVLGLLTAFMTAFYMFRTYYLTFHGRTRADHHAFEHARESPPSITVPLMLLAGGSIIAGFIGLPEYTHFDNFQKYLEPVTGQGALLAAEVLRHGAAAHGAEAGHAAVHHGIGLELGLAAVSVIVALAGSWLATQFYYRNFPKQPEAAKRTLEPFYELSWNLWYYNKFCMNAVAGGLMQAYRWVLSFDVHVVDGIVNGTGQLTRKIGAELRQMQTGQAQGYAFWLLLGVNFIIFIFILFTF